MSATFHVGDAGAFDLLAGPGSLDCLVQDPPAGIAFMSASFDRDHGGRDAWIKLHAGLFAAGRRACKPGAWSLTWALPRTSHWTACALDDAGWEITDCLTHLNGQGWPKNARTQLKPASEHWYLARNGGGGALQIDASRVARGGDGDRSTSRPASTAPKWGGSTYASDEYSRTTASTDSPAHPAGSWPTNAVLSHAPCCREQGTREVLGGAAVKRNRDGSADEGSYSGRLGKGTVDASFANGSRLETVPAFSCLAACSCGLTTLAPSGGQPPRCDCGEAMTWACPVALLDEQSGNRPTSKAGSVFRRTPAPSGVYADHAADIGREQLAFGDKGGASRFFPTFAYAAKAATSERHAGAEHLLWWRDPSTSLGWREQDREDFDKCKPEARATGNIHPTVKSLKLCRWLVRLLCPPGGRGGDPFCGSGSIGIAAMLEGFEWISSDLSPEAIRIARARMEHWSAVKAAEDKEAWDIAHPSQGSLFDLFGGAS